MATSESHTVKVEGLKGVVRDLKRFDADAPKKLKAVGTESAEIVAAAARPITPSLTGRLRSVIRTGSTLKGAYVQAATAYAGVIHFGWPAHNIAPQPFLYEALDSRRDEVIAAYEAGISDLIDATVHSGVSDG